MQQKETHIQPAKDDDLELIETNLLLEGVYRRFGMDFRGYAMHHIRRRIRGMLRAEGFATISHLQAAILHDEKAYRSFINWMSIGNTAMFRDPGFYAALREQVVPFLRTYPRVAIWIAGCSDGQEVYSLAILLEEEGIYDRCQIYATDMNEQYIETAKAGVYPKTRIEDASQNYYECGGKTQFTDYYSVENDRVRFNQSLRRNVTFAQHNLISDSSFNEFNLILCRNVLMYLGSVFQQRVFWLLHESLNRSGIVGLGMRESINANPYGAFYEVVDSENRLFRKAADVCWNV